MKKLFSILLLALSIVFGVVAQDDEPRVLLSQIDDVSGFGGPIFQFTNIDGQMGFMTGGGGAVLLNRRIFIGGYPSFSI